VTEKTKTLGIYDDTGNPKEPILWISKVIQKGDDLPSGKNHADYIDPNGKYDIVKYMQDHKENSLELGRLSLGH
jgi:hypothetical protein